MDIPVTIKLLSPTHLGSGRADVNLDQDVVTDRLGIPFFPGRRFKGLLYESLLEVADMGASGLVLCTREEADTLFHHGRDDGPQMLVPDFHLDEYDELKAGWAYLEENYQEWFTAEEVLEEYSSSSAWAFSLASLICFISSALQPAMSAFSRAVRRSMSL